MNSEINLLNIEKIYAEIKEVTTLNTTNFIIQGGYFESNIGISQFARNSIILASQLGQFIKKKSQRNNVIYDLLVNDLGLVCSDQVCSISNILKEKHEVLELASSLITDLQIKTQFSISTESNLKNKGLRKVRKILKAKSIDNNLYPKLYCNQNVDERKWYIKSNYGNDILLFLIRNNNFVAKCPLIMGAYYADQFLKIHYKNQQKVTSLVIIDFCSYADKDKVTKGAEVALELFHSPELSNLQKIIIPIFCDSICETIIPTIVT